MDITEKQRSIFAPIKYHGANARIDTVYAAICGVISGHSDPTIWKDFIKTDWAFLITISGSEYEGVGPLLYFLIKNNDWIDHFPGSIVEKLRIQYYNASAQNNLHFSELSRIGKTLTENNIPYIVLKGAVLAAQIYPEEGVRPMGDLDFLIHGKDAASAEHALRLIGYTEESGLKAWPGFEDEVEREIFLLGGPANRIGVDIHHALIAGKSDTRSPDLDVFWNHTIDIYRGNGAAQDEKIPSLSWDLHLLYIIAHMLIQHGAENARLIWLVDVHYLISKKSSEINWTFTLKLAEQLGWVESFLSAITQCHKLFGTPIPIEVEGLLSDPAVRAATETPWMKAQVRRSRTERHLNKIQQYPVKLQYKFFLRTLFPTREYLDAKYKINPPWIWPLYYVVRLIDVSFDVLRTYLFRQ